MWKRFFCGDAPTTIESNMGSEWVVARTQLLQTQALHCKAKVLNVIEEEIEEIHRNVGAKKVALRASTMKRVHRANLPMEESQRATELLGKITALDRSRIDLERKCTELSYALAATEEAKRLAEFDAEKAHAMARARGEVLARQHQRIVETEAHQAHLIDMLHTALAQLGMSIEEIKALGGVGEQKSVEDSARVPHVEDSAAEAAVSVQQDGHAAGGNTNNSSIDNNDGRVESPISPHMFTIYSNDLSDTPPAAPDTMLNIHRQDQGNSATKWKDISEAAALSPNPPTASAMNTPVQQQLHPNHHHHSMQLPATVERRAKHLANLIVPQLKPEQLASLVQLGSKASSPSAITPNTQRQMLQVVYETRGENDPGAEGAALAGKEANIRVNTEEGSHQAKEAVRPNEKKKQLGAKKSSKATAVSAPRFSTFNTSEVLKPAGIHPSEDLIRAILPPSMVNNESEEQAARQQRAMERLKARLNNKLSSSGKKKKSPKGSLRERAEKEAARALFAA